jgi:hypothetical protein
MLSGVVADGRYQERYLSNSKRVLIKDSYKRGQSDAANIGDQRH